MKTFHIPYGSGQLSFATADDRPVTVLRPAGMSCRRDSSDRPQPEADLPCSDEAAGLGGMAGTERAEQAVIAEALAHPIDSPPLHRLAKGKKKVVVVTSDHTRPVPSRLTLPLMMADIRKGSPDAAITVLIGVGSHRATTREEMIAKFGAAFVAAEHIVNHDPHDPEGLISLGRLPSGGELILNKPAVEADLLVADGFIEPHQFAGFSGGRKSILPGIAGLRAVLASHNAEFTGHPNSRPGVLDGNLFHIDMLHAARAAKLAFILNVALTPEKRVAAAFAGEMDAAHRAGCDFVMRRCGLTARPTPIVITSNGGYPLDQNLYQATKSIMTADAVCAPAHASGGVIIAVNECRDGYGTADFYHSFKDAPSLAGALAEIRGRGRDETQPDQWVTQLIADILLRRTVIFVSSLAPETVAVFGMRHAAGLEDALATAERLVGDADAPITVLPDAVSLVIAR